MLIYWFSISEFCTSNYEYVTALGLTNQLSVVFACWFSFFFLICRRHRRRHKHQLNRSARAQFIFRCSWLSNRQTKNGASNSYGDERRYCVFPSPNSISLTRRTKWVSLLFRRMHLEYYVLFDIIFLPFENSHPFHKQNTRKIWLMKHNMRK